MNSDSIVTFVSVGISLIALVLAAGCASTGETDSAKMAFDYRASDPIIDAKEKFAERDYRIYVVVKGMRGFYPGVDRNVGAYWEQRYGVAELPGASDFFDRDDYPEFVAAATNYASVYNRTMTDLLAAAEKAGTEL